MIYCRIDSLDPNNHELDISIVFKSELKSIDLFLPKWRPGRYEASDFAVNLKNLKIFDSKGEEIPYIQIQSNGWRLSLGNSNEFTVQYTFYANKMDAGNSVVNDEQLYINFVNCILYAQELIDKPINLSLNIPNNYKVECALKRNKKGDLLAENYHELVDSPLLASAKLNILEYTISKTNFKIIFMGKHPLKNKDILDDFRKFTQKQCDVMGGFPCSEYLFFIQSLDYKHYHGVEHKRSTVLVLGPNTEAFKDDYYEKLMGVASHELFHSWNVTRIRPAEMSPYNYKDEINFDTGFVAEGFTTYYGDHFLITSDTYTTEQYLKELNTLCNRHFSNFGRFRISLIETSKRLWLDGYKNIFPSNKVSIYVKGALSSLILDLNIRKATNHQSSLIDVVKTMYNQYTFEHGGYSSKQVFQLLKELGGTHVDSLAQSLIEGSSDIEPLLIQALDFVGFKLVLEPHKDKLAAHTGIIAKENIIVDLHPDCPYRNLSIGDEIIGLNKKNLDVSQAPKTGDLLEVKHSQNLLKIEILITERIYLHNYSIGIDERCNADQTKFREEWLSN
ncbi:MAG: M61 family metallopeptidase [Reichenbachiella sp.]